MLPSTFSYLCSGVRKIRDNPQFIYTIGIAIVIVAAFILTATRFISIAKGAQERLAETRIDSLQDAFVSFAADRMNDPQYLNARIADISADDEAIKQFRVILAQDVFTGATTTAYIVIASSDSREIGRADPQAAFLYALASKNPTRSVTAALDSGTGKVFSTARAIVSPSGTIEGVVTTTQTPSAADKAIQDDITDSTYMLTFSICVVMLLFFLYSRIIDYMDLYERLADVDQLKDSFISMASHEMRTPLTIIRGYVDFLHNAPELSPESKDFASKIEFGSKALELLIADMLDVSRIEQGRMSYAMEKFEPSPIVASAIASFEMLAKNKALELSFDTSRVEPDQVIYADKDRFRQVLINLIGNAVKYTSKGSVRVDQYAESGRVYIRVRDTGIGISAENRERLFKKFYRVRSKETETIAGTGIGLWIAAQIIKEMKGAISVESIEGVGSHFVISFPIVPTVDQDINRT